MTKRLYILGVFLLTVFFSQQLPAQQSQTPPASQMTVKQAPDRYISEMQGFFEYCGKDGYLSKNFDCRCLAAEYFSLRTEKGPTARTSQIMKELDKEKCSFEKKSGPFPQEEPGLDMSKISDADIKEAHEFFNRCRSEPNLSRNYDCECLSSKYLSERLKQGKEGTASSIFLMIRKDCPNVAGAAGIMYNQCMKSGTLIARNQPLKEFCECTANKFAKKYKNIPVEPGSQHYHSLMSQAMGECTRQPGDFNQPR